MNSNNSYLNTAQYLFSKGTIIWKKEPLACALEYIPVAIMES